VPSPPEPIDLRVERPAQASRIRARFARWLNQLVRRPRWRRRSAATAPTTPPDLWNAWAAAELECGVALLAWRLAAPGDKGRTYDAYVRALEREDSFAATLGRGATP
jgi:hypothetical protein